MLSSSQSLSAATITVNSTADDSSSCTLREALNSLIAGSSNNCSAQTQTAPNDFGTDDTIIFDLPATSTISLGSNLPLVTVDMTITGPGQADLTIDGSDTHAAFDIDSATVEISNLKVSNMVTAGTGSAVRVRSKSEVTLDTVTLQDNQSANGGAGFSESGSMTIIKSSTVTGNHSSIAGGGWTVEGGTLLVSEGSTISNNTASARGGGVAGNQNANITIQNSNISNNVAQGNISYPILNGGGGIYTATAALQVSDSTISGNTATARYGGGIFMDESDNVTISGTTISSNQWVGSGGGIFVSDSDNFALTNSTISGHTLVNGAGAGMFVQNSANANITGSTISNNETFSGGAMRTFRAHDMTISESTITGNSASNFGGGLFIATSYRVMVDKSTISSNSVTALGSKGGGLNIVGADDMTISDSTISGNYARDLGAGMHIGYSGGLHTYNFKIEQTTISGNSAEFTGGGIAIENVPGMTVSQSTITGNDARLGLGGGMRIDDSPDFNLLNSIVSGNSAVAETEISALNSSFDNVSFNVLGDNSSGFDNGFMNFSPDATNILAALDAGGSGLTAQNIPLNEIIGELDDNGGPTQTHELVAGSPAINSGQAPCPDFDQNGSERTDGMCDIGSFEFINGELCYVIPTPNGNTVIFCL